MQKYLTEARQLLALAIPVILAQVAQTAMGFVDTIMAGAVSATDMAAVAVGTSIWLPAILFGHGLLLALTPTVAQLNGSGRRERIAEQVRQAYWLAFFVAILIMVVLWNAGYVIRAMQDIDEQLALKAEGYLHALLWGAPGYLFFQVMRNQCEGLSKTKPGMVMGFIGLLVNIPLNWIFIYGHFGMPALGGVGYGLGAGWIYCVAAALYLSAFASIATLVIERAPPRKEPTTWRTLFAGITFIFQRRLLLGTLSLDLFAVLLGGATALLPIFAKDILNAGPWALGALRAAPACGAALMSLTLARLSLGEHVGRLLFGALIVFGLATTVFGLSTSIPLSIAALVVLGAADAVSVVVRSSLVQLNTPDHMLGRVSAVNTLFVGTSNQLGEFESGVMAAMFGAVPAVVIGGIGTIAVAGLWMRWFPELRKLKSLHAP
ncbi:MATE family efflux transporter [Achromobacter insolitus]|uniref:MATE family efflux transporter n=1 Tax=Achromobacter insolitus TaxID=217204 RepID=UPI002FE080F4